MQVFLPYPSFAHSVAVLDRARLGKQRLECAQILNAILKPEEPAIMGITKAKAWSNHPATNMWRGHEAALGAYMTFCIREWVARGYRNFMDTPYDEQGAPTVGYGHQEHMAESMAKAAPPAWLGREDVHASHRARLLHKDPFWYGQFGWTEEPADDKTGYVWPV